MDKTMKNSFKKAVGLGSIMSLALMSLSFTLPAKADATVASTSTVQSEIQNQDKEIQDQVKDNNGENNDKDESNVNDVNEHEHEEGDVNNDIQDQMDIEKEVKLSNVNLTTISTYGDIVTYLKSLQTEIAKIEANGTVDASSSNLSVAEQALLAKLVNKHADNFKSLKADTAALNSEVQALIDLLSPISTSTIAPELRGLIRSEVKDLRSQVKDLANLEALDFQVLDQETK